MRTDENLKLICDELSRNCGDLHGAARFVGMSPAMLMAWMKDDDTAAKDIQNAQSIGWLGLESAAIERAVHGVEEAVFYKGEEISKKVVYSDGLLGKLLEARVPAFNKKEAGTTFNGPTQINIMPRAENYEGWLEMKALTLKQRAIDEEEAGRPALPPPDLNDDVPLAEFTIIDDQRPLACLRGLI